MKKSNGTTRGISDHELLTLMLREAAKASFPSGMSRRGGILNGGAKDEAVKFFVGVSFVRKLTTLQSSRLTAASFLEWHSSESKRLALLWCSKRLIRRETARQRRNNARIVAAKVLDLFLHRLMIHERFRKLARYLNLPLDGKIVAALRRNGFAAARELPSSPYGISVKEYHRFQLKLGRARLKDSGWSQLDSNAHLNVLWAD